MSLKRLVRFSYRDLVLSDTLLLMLVDLLLSGTHFSIALTIDLFIVQHCMHVGSIVDISFFQIIYGPVRRIHLSDDFIVKDTPFTFIHSLKILSRWSLFTTDAPPSVNSEQGVIEHLTEAVQRGDPVGAGFSDAAFPPVRDKKII